MSPPEAGGRPSPGPSEVKPAATSAGGGSGGGDEAGTASGASADTGGLVDASPRACDTSEGPTATPLGAAAAAAAGAADDATGWCSAALRASPQSRMSPARLRSSTKSTSSAAAARARESLAATSGVPRLAPLPPPPAFLMPRAIWRYTRALSRRPSVRAATEPDGGARGAGAAALAGCASSNGMEAVSSSSGRRLPLPLPSESPPVAGTAAAPGADLRMARMTRMLRATRRRRDSFAACQVRLVGLEFAIPSPL